VQQHKEELIEASGVSPSNDPYFGAAASSSTPGGPSTSSKIFSEFCKYLIC
jgi:hypothetical protein